MDDNFVAILALHAEAEGVFASVLPTTYWQTLLAIHELRLSNWLLAYEASVQGWLASGSGVDHIASDPDFAFLRAQDIRFYDVGRKGTYQPRRFGGGGGPFGYPG